MKIALLGATGRTGTEFMDQASRPATRSSPTCADRKPFRHGPGRASWAASSMTVLR